jgi:O-antigen ligase
LSVNDRLLTAALAALLFGTTLAFGGHAWWAPPAIAVLCLVLVAGCLTRMLLAGRMRVLKSPLTALGGLAVGTALAQVVTLPEAVSAALSPSSRAAYAVGFLPERARALDPAVEMPEPPAIRSPVSLDRPATLRWVTGALACLAVFWAAAQFTDRLGRLYVVWGSVVAAFFLNTALAMVQLSCRARGLFGRIEPGRGPAWGPNLNDLMTAPGASLLRVAGAPQPDHPAWALPVPDRPFLLGTMMGGPGAYLALGALGLPLALALALQLMAPRGSREPLGVRLAQSGRGGLVALLVIMLLASAAVTGLLAGPALAVPFALGLLAVGLPCAWPTGLRWSAVGLTSLAVAVLAAGAAGGDLWASARGVVPPPVAPASVSASARVWLDALPIVRDFPILGTGLGTFASVYPFYKTRDEASTTAMSSLLQWWVGSGFVGLGLLLAAGVWCLARIPSAVRSVGTADRALVFGLIGAALGFSLFSTVHWTVELVSVALAASAVGGTLNRWLAGGTDLFAERG